MAFADLPLRIRPSVLTGGLALGAQEPAVVPPAN